MPESYIPEQRKPQLIWQGRCEVGKARAHSRKRRDVRLLLRCSRPGGNEQERVASDGLAECGEDGQVERQAVQQITAHCGFLRTVTTLTIACLPSQHNHDVRSRRPFVQRPRLAFRFRIIPIDVPIDVHPLWVGPGEELFASPVTVTNGDGLAVPVQICHDSTCGYTLGLASPEWSSEHGGER